MASSSEDISGASATQTAMTDDGNEILLLWRLADDDRKLLNSHHFENNLLNDIINWYLPSLSMCNFMVTWFHRL